MLIGIIAGLWVVKSVKVLICEGIEATPIYYLGTNACTCIAPKAKYALQYEEVWPHLTLTLGVFQSRGNVQPNLADIDYHGSRSLSIHC